MKVTHFTIRVTISSQSLVSSYVSLELALMRSNKSKQSSTNW